MWTSRVIAKGNDDRGLTITVLFTDGTSEVKEVFAPRSQDELDGIIRATLDKLNANSDFVKDVAIGDYTPGAGSLNEDARKLQAALADYGKWQRAVTIGLVAPDDSVVTDAHLKLIAAFRPDLIDFLVG